MWQCHVLGDLPWYYHGFMNILYTMEIPCFWRFNMALQWLSGYTVYNGNTMILEIYVGTTMAFWIYTKAVPCFRRITLVLPMLFEYILGYDNTMFWKHSIEIPYFIYPRIYWIYIITIPQFGDLPWYSLLQV